MTSRFKSCTAARRVTGIAVTNTAGVVRPAAADESSGRMTGGAVQAGRNVRGYGIHHADCRIAIMTRDAIVDDAGMIEGCRNEGTGIMADTTILIGRHMIGFLRRRETSRVTGRAVIHDTRMIKGCRQKARGLVAVDAIAVGRHVVVVFSRGSNAIVTRSAVIQDTLVIKRGLGKRCGGMAHRTILGDRNMGWVNLGIGSGRDDAIVTRRTVVDDAGMIEYGRLKAATGCVANPAILGCQNVAGIHTLCRASPVGYVTGIAALGQHCGVAVVDICVGKINCVMAQCTIGGGCRVRRRGCFASGSQCDKIGAAIVAGYTIASDTLVSQHRGWCEAVDIMANVTILARRHVVYLFN